MYYYFIYGMLYRVWIFNIMYYVVDRLSYVMTHPNLL
jgi:hypothetical protein